MARNYKHIYSHGQEFKLLPNTGDGVSLLLLDSVKKMKITEQIKKSKIQVSAANGELLNVCRTVTIPITLLKEAIDIQHLEYCWKRMFEEEDEEEENTNHICPRIKRRKIKEIVERTDNNNVRKQDKNKFLGEFFFPARVYSTSPKTDNSVPSWNIPPQDTEAACPPRRTTTAENPKSTFWVSPLLGTLQEGFCPPGWLTSKPPLMDTGEFFFWPVLTTPPDKDPKTICDKKVEQPLRGFLSKATLQKAVGMFLLTTHTLES